MTFLKGIISLSIAVILLANVFIQVVKGTNTSTWDTEEVALWGLLTLMGIVGLVYGIGSVFGII